MKYLITIFFFFPFIIFGQDLNGNYSTKTSLNGKSITFYKDSSFLYKKWGCLGNDFGDGKFKLSDDSLFLVFTKNEDYFKENFAIIDSSESNSDIVIFKIQLYDSDSNKLSRVNINITKDEGYYQNETIAETITDKNGLAIVELQKSSNIVWLNCSEINWKPVSVKVNSNKNFDFVGFIDQKDAIKLDNQIMKFPIKKIKKDKIILLSPNNINKEKLYLFKTDN